MIFIYLHYYLKIPPQNYKLWDVDNTLKKFIPISTFLGIIFIMGLLISFWKIWGFFGTPLVIFSTLKSIVNIINIL